MHEPEGFHDFVTGRSPALLRSAWLLTGDWHLAHDLVQEALVRTWLRGSADGRPHSLESYVRKTMLNTYLSWYRRRRWKAEVATATLPEYPGCGDSSDQADVRLAVRDALAGLTPRQRAVVVLRFFEDLTESQAADALCCSVGTVKSQTAKALSRLRDDPNLGVYAEQVKA